MSAVRYEWTRVRTLRASWVALAAVLLLGAAATWVAARTAGAVPADSGYAARIVTSGASVFTPPVVAVAAAVVAVLSCARDQGSAVLLVLPRRSRAVAAKALTTAVVAAATAAVGLAADALVAAVVLGPADFRALAWHQDPAPRILGCYIAYVTLAALLGLGIGIVARGASLAAALVAALPLVVEPLAAQAADIGLSDPYRGWAAYLPFTAADRMLAVSGPGLSAGRGALVFGAWAFLSLVVATVVHRRRKH